MKPLKLGTKMKVIESCKLRFTVGGIESVETDKEYEQRTGIPVASDFRQPGDLQTIYPREFRLPWENDPDLYGMILDRQRLLKQLVPLLRRVGASHPQRSQVNADRSTRRKKVRQALRANAEAMAARLLELADG